MSNIKEAEISKTEEKVFWFDARDLKQEETILPLVNNLRFEYLLIKLDMYPRVNVSKRIKLIVDIDHSDADISLVSNETIIMSNNEEVLRGLHSSGYRTAFYRKIESQKEMEEAWMIGKQADFLVIDLVAETNIPLELIIARLQERDTILLKIVNSLEDAEIALGVMEAGSDGVVLKTEDVQEIIKVNDFLAKKEIGQLDLVKAKVVDVEHIGMGYRACIDTTNLMQQNEGMIIGSTSSGGFLVSSETHYLPYMELRPFRVNAGAVHSYVWAPNGMTAYITELKAGGRVLCVDSSGNTREVSVGRLKIEMRPLLKIEAEAEGVRINVIVQDDWHIRIFGGDGKVRNVSNIKKGDDVLVYICNSGRHVGVKIKETIEER